MNQIGFLSKFLAEIRNPLKGGFKAGGWFDMVVRDTPANGAVILGKHRVKNGMTNVGLDNILNAYFVGSAQTTVWYVGLIDNAAFSALAAADTMSSHAGWTESTAYSEGVRQTWGVGASSGQSVTNASAMVFTASGTVTIKGAFLVSVSTKAGSSGILLATGAFSSNQLLTVGQTLNVTYTNTATGS